VTRVAIDRGGVSSFDHGSLELQMHEPFRDERNFAAVIMLQIMPAVLSRSLDRYLLGRKAEANLTPYLHAEMNFERQTLFLGVNRKILMCHTNRSQKWEACLFLSTCRLVPGQTSSDYNLTAVPESKLSLMCLHSRNTETTVITRMTGKTYSWTQTRMHTDPDSLWTPLRCWNMQQR
jgi:hypothetical protein